MQDVSSAMEFGALDIFDWLPVSEMQSCQLDLLLLSMGAHSSPHSGKCHSSDNAFQRHSQSWAELVGPNPHVSENMGRSNPERFRHLSSGL